MILLEYNIEADYQDNKKLSQFLLEPGPDFINSGALPQPLPLDIDPEPRPVVRLSAEALRLCGKVLGLLGWNATLMDLDGHSFLKCLDIRDEGRVCYRGSAHDVPSHSLIRSDKRIPSTISR